MQTISARANLQFPQDRSRIEFLDKAKEGPEQPWGLSKQESTTYTRAQRDATVVGERVEQATVWEKGQMKEERERNGSLDPSVMDCAPNIIGSFGKGLKLGHCHLKYILLSFMK